MNNGGASDQGARRFFIDAAASGVLLLCGGGCRRRNSKCEVLDMEKQLRLCREVRIDFDAIAKGLIRMMKEAGDETSLNVMRFGMLPAKWVELAEREFKAKFDEQFAYYRHVAKYVYDLLGQEYDPDEIHVVAKPGRPPYEFSFKKLMAEVMHELALALYSNTKMVV